MDIKVETMDAGRLVLNADFKEILAFNGIDSFDKLWNIPSEPVKKVLKQRGTERVFLKTPDGILLEAYIKRYRPEPFKEKLKNLLALRPARYPGALNEWNAIIEFHRKGLPTMMPAAYASGGGDSCLLTLAIRDYVRASELFAGLAGGDRDRRRKIIRKIAELAAGMHSAGLAHQDFYLVHMFVRKDEDDKVYLIDLQRTVFSQDFSERWRVKDLAQLLFSSRKFASRTDIMFFWKIYSAGAGGRMLKDGSLIRKICRKAERIGRHAG